MSSNLEVLKTAIVDKTKITEVCKTYQRDVSPHAVGWKGGALYTGNLHSRPNTCIDEVISEIDFEP